jgi:hypothetical protein
VSDLHQKSKMTPIERLGTGLGVMGIGVALFMGLPPPWWPDMPPNLVHAGVAFGIALIFVGAALVLHSALGAARQGRGRMLPLIGMAVFGIAFLGCAAWYFWPQTRAQAAASISDHENFRRMIITTRLRDEYLKTESKPFPMIQAGLEFPPAGWFNQKLKELGEDWQIQTELKLSSEPGLFIECHLVRFPIKTPPNGQVYALNLNAIPLEAGGGGIAEYSSQPGSDMILGPEITMGQRCIVTNHGSKPLVNVELALNLLFQEQIKDKDTPNASRSGNIILERPWRVDIKKIDPSPGAQFEFYIWNMTSHFANVSFFGKATAEYIGSLERFEFHVSSSNPYPISVNPINEIQAAPKSPPEPHPPDPLPPNRQGKK